MALFAIALGSSIAVVGHAPIAQAPPFWWILPAIALVAEFMPVQLSRGGARLTFTLPYVVGMAIAIGPVGAVATDVGATAIGGVVFIALKLRPLTRQWLVANLCTAAIACIVGSVAMEKTATLHLVYPWNQPASTLSFLVSYGAAHFAISTGMEWLSSRNKVAERFARSVRQESTSLALYTVVGLMVTVLVRHDLVWLAPLTIAPIYALRSSLAIQAKMYDNYYETITALTLMLQRAHPYTHGHLERVAETAEEVARRLGLSRRRARLIREAAVLHDIGKIAVDEQILDQPRRLTEAEFAHVRRHSECGAQILAPVKQFHEMVPWIRYHHERPDGTGYPDQLSDIEIPIESKIIAVVDAYDAMTGSGDPGQQRSYRKPMTIDEAMRELKACSGTQFDSAVVDAFEAVVAGASR